MIKERVYNGLDNTIDLVLKEDGSAQDLSSVTSILLKDENGAIDLDSDVDADIFTWTGLSTGQVELVLGDESIPDGTYLCRIITIDAVNTNGICWGEFEIEVITP